MRIASAYHKHRRRGLIRKVGDCKRARGHATAGGIVWAAKSDPIDIDSRTGKVNGPTTFSFR